VTNIILCGGSGTRLWPLSRKLMPKQFLKLFDNKSLFQLTIERNSKICDKSVIVSNEEQYFLALDQIDELENEGAKQKTQFMLEEIGKNTAPAIALSCMSLDKDDIVLVTPSDHLIKNENTRVEYLSDRVRKINPLEVQVEWLKNTCCSELIPTQKMSIEE